MRGTYVDQPRFVALASAGGCQQQRELANARAHAHAGSAASALQATARSRFRPWHRPSAARARRGTHETALAPCVAVLSAGSQGRLQGDESEARGEVGHESRGAMAGVSVGVLPQGVWDPKSAGARAQRVHTALDPGLRCGHPAWAHRP